MALRNLAEPLRPPVRPPWRSHLSTPQIGPICEDLLAVSLMAAAGGLGTTARPAVDRGWDLYLRRLRSLLTIPFQVKGFTHASPDGSVGMDLLASDVHDHPRGQLAFVHLPQPYDQLYRRLFLIPISEFRKRCPLVTSGGKPAYRFVANLTGTARDPWSDYLIDIDGLPAWLAAVSGWTEPVPPAPSAASPALIGLKEAGSHDKYSEAHLGRLWVMQELERVGRNRIVMVEDRVRLDTVTLLTHQIVSGKIAGLHIRTAVYPTDRRIHFDVKRRGFFTDPNLYVVLVLLHKNHRPHDFSLVIPSEKIPELGYSETLTLDPLTKRFRPYLVPSEKLGPVLFSQLLGS